MKTSLQNSLGYDDMCVLLGEIVFDKIKSGIDPSSLCIVDLLREESVNKGRWSEEKRLTMIKVVDKLS